MKEKNEPQLVRIILNNWAVNVDYPADPIIIKWIDESTAGDYLRSDEFCRQNEICVRYAFEDMSTTYLIVAKMDWIEENGYECLLDFADDNLPSRFDEYDLSEIFPEYTKKNMKCVFVPDLLEDRDFGDPDPDDEDDFDDDEDDIKPSGRGFGRKSPSFDDDYEESPYENSDIYDD